MKHIPDIIALTGLFLIGYGLWLYDPKVCYVVCGVILLACGIIGSINQSRLPSVSPRAADDAETSAVEEEGARCKAF